MLSSPSLSPGICLKLMSVESEMPSNRLILCCPLLLLLAVFLSIRVLSSESTLCITWPKYRSFSFNISPSSEYSGLISFRIDWYDLLAVHGTLKSLPQHHSGASSILRHVRTMLLERQHGFSMGQERIAPNKQGRCSQREANPCARNG